ncbi:hypothetical protein GGTG_04940 [Gaeumannomyces tritici R3-111a-1]|uniref:Uncharacterized protein n=1 Tax=Gaeumannomyces tritici (strain R3-111a-1) TaxID=644352 RepID=J3NUI4_GAET3|nr:hypothetical protein GGTG_04940 [Gaeumannomyces tritici R3-111a-1]EJT79857.1 hypothetical protein GGTG_04940 [Gaeumannomyces tritici R3-111a-1]
MSSSPVEKPKEEGSFSMSKTSRFRDEDPMVPGSRGIEVESKEMQRGQTSGARMSVSQEGAMKGCQAMQSPMWEVSE